MSSCTTCGNRDYLCEQCKMEALEDRYGTPADQDVDRWVLGADRELWHAGVEFDGQVHSCVCGDDVETPLEWSTEDLRYAPDRYADVPVCHSCVAALEGARSETVPDDAAFKKASEVMTDGGEDPERFTDLPVPDRFFQQISSAEIDYRVEDWERDEIRFSAQNVPGGKFGFEIAASYSYAGYDCKQHVTLDVDGAVELRKALTEALESKGYDPETGEREIVTDGGEQMDRITLRIPGSQLEALDSIAEDHYPNRSEAVRDAIRTLTQQYQTVPTDGGLEEVFRRETIVGTDDGIAIGEGTVPMDIERNGAVTVVSGPETEAYERDRGEDDV